MMPLKTNTTLAVQRKYDLEKYKWIGGILYFAYEQFDWSTIIAEVQIAYCLKALTKIDDEHIAMKGQYPPIAWIIRS